VQVTQIGRDLRSPRVEPGTLTDAIAGVDARMAGRRRRTQVSAPLSPAGTRGRRQRLAMRIGAFDAAQITAIA
jgi:hypothetical protein